MELVMLYSTWPDEGSASACAEALIAQRLAACVTVIPAAQSHYCWEGEREWTREHPMLVKTSKDRAQAARDLIVAMHPYDLASVIGFTVNSEISHAPYLDWAFASTR
ncbi:MAG: divalent-cation tolerance protein CutA [Hydrogenophilaceae bacterium]|jgi:periplasmic divalent cation tolerance protein|nr:divalent-cation tolerance protein CutA [Hydrogenophilaceae bacterium]